MKRTCGLLTGLIASGLLLAGCSTHVTYKEADFSGNKTYKKPGVIGPQLSESEVLGIGGQGSPITDEEFRRVLEEVRSFKIKQGSTVLLVQSGAAAPDPAMVGQLSNYFTVVPHSGIPGQIALSDSEAGISKALRLAAAQSKAETILVCWGNLELKRDDLPTSLVSWVPVVDFMVPDEYQKMRMSLKVALIDVRSGNWASFRTEPIEEDAVTTRYAREHEHKWPLESIKQKTYASAARTLQSAYLE